MTRNEAHEREVREDATKIVHFNEGISSIEEIAAPFPESLLLLSLHHNSISELTSLNRFRNLVHLDVSSNRIREIAGLEGLGSLQSLNLSSNDISKICKLGGLVSLQKLSVSYNRITSLSGMICLHGSNYQLRTLDLRGNNISSIDEFDYLSGLVNLRTLSFGGSSDTNVVQNPVCSTADNWKAYAFSKVCGLQFLDGDARVGGATNTGYYDTSVFVPAFTSSWYTAIGMTIYG